MVQCCVCLDRQPRSTTEMGFDLASSESALADHRLGSEQQAQTFWTRMGCRYSNLAKAWLNIQRAIRIWWRACSSIFLGSL